MLTLSAPTIDELKQSIDFLCPQPTIVRGLVTREVLGAVLSWPIGIAPRRAGQSRRLGLLEGFFMMAGRFSLQSVLQVAPKVDPHLFTPMAQYGPRVVHQWPRLVRTLQKDPSSRRAILVLPRWQETSTENCPCTVAVQFLIRRGLLNLFCYYRSWDITWGLPYDVMSIGLLGQATAQICGVIPRNLTVFVSSLHYYDTTERLAAGDSFWRYKLKLATSSLPDMVRAAREAVAHPERILDFCDLAILDKGGFPTEGVLV